MSLFYGSCTVSVKFTSAISWKLDAHNVQSFLLATMPGWRMCLFAVAWVWRINLHCALNRGVVGKAAGRFWPQSHRRNNEFDSHVQPFTSTRETSWRLYLFKAGLSQGGACKNSSPDQLRERERSRREGERQGVKGVWGMKPSVLSLTLLCHKRHSFWLLNHDDMSVAFWVMFINSVCIGYLDDLQHLAKRAVFGGVISNFYKSI